MSILVTGATGNAGREVVRALRARGASVRAAGRSAEGPDAVALDFADRSTWGAALGGADALFLMRPPAIADVEATLIPFARAAREAEVGQIVFLSVAGAERSRWVPHRKVEDHLIAEGAGHTILRPGFFAQNLQDSYRLDIREDHRLYVPAGRGRVAFLDLRDLGEVAAEALTDPAAHRGAAYHLTGPEAVTFAEVAGTLSEALGRPIRYEPASVPGYARHLRARGLPWPAVGIQTYLHVGLRFGQAEAVDPTLADLLGHPPRNLCAYVAEHRAVWLRPGGAERTADRPRYTPHDTAAPGSENPRP